MRAMIERKDEQRSEYQPDLDVCQLPSLLCLPERNVMSALREIDVHSIHRQLPHALSRQMHSLSIPA